jgi:Flp pilus assembly protein TadD
MVRKQLVRVLLLLLAGWLLATLSASGQTSAGLEVLRLAESRATHGERTAAAAAYQQALALLPDDPYPALRLAALYAGWGHGTEGLRALTEATRRGAAAAQLTPLRLTLLAQAGQWEPLAREATLRLAEAPTDAQALALLTQAQTQQGDCAIAAETAGRWQAAAPDDPAAQQAVAALQPCATPGCHLRYGQQCLAEGQWALAVCSLEQAVAATPTSAEAHAWLGEALSRAGRPTEARRALEQATTLAPEAPVGWLLLGLHALRQNDVVTAQEALHRAQQLDPGNPAPCLGLMEVAALNANYTAVDSWTEAALLRGPEDAEVWKAVARFYVARGLQRNEFPGRAAEQAIRLAPSDAAAWILLGRSRLLAGDAGQALLALDQAVALAPTLAEAHAWRGEALAQLGRPAEAAQAQTRAADLQEGP